LLPCILDLSAALSGAGCGIGAPESAGALPHGGSGDADTGEEAVSGSGGVSDTPPASRAGNYEALITETSIATGSVRSSALVWDGDAWLVAYVGVTDWFGVYVSPVTRAGDTLLPGETQRIDDGGYDGFEAEIASDEEGTSVVVYEDDRAGAGQCCREIYARRLDRDGTPVGAAFNVSNEPTLEEWLPAIAEESGAWLVAWSDDRERANDDRRLLYGRTITSAGELGTEYPLGPDSLWQVFANVTGSEGDGRFLVTWGDYDPVGGSLDCGYRARLVGLDGAPIGDVIEIARIGNQVYDRPAVAYNSYRHAWLVAWMTPYEIHGTWIDLEGNTEDLGTLIAPEIGAGAARLTYADANDTFILGWHAWWTSEGFVSQLDGDGAVVGDPIRVTAEAPPLGTFYVPVAADDEGAVLAAPSLNYSRVVADLYVPAR
jgi:hypothetical protein